MEDFNSYPHTMNGEQNAKPVNVDPRWCVPEMQGVPQGPTS
jgi:hypothetical protein